MTSETGARAATMHRLWAFAVVGLTAATAIAVFGDVESPIRPAVTLAFLVVCPGFALARLLRLNDIVFELTLAVALSLAVDGIVAGITLYLGEWSPSGTLGALMGITLLATAAGIVRNRTEGGAVPR